MKKLAGLLAISGIAYWMLKKKNKRGDKSWMHSANIYEVNIRQITEEGTFKAFECHLPRLKKMGVKVLWFMPITPIAQKNKKGSLGSPYASQHFRAVNPEFGSLTDFINLVALAHQMGFKVIMDWVANHTGWDHVWTLTNPDYYKHDATTNSFKVASGMDDIIELDFANEKMRLEMISAMKFWVEKAGVDGFRCDLAAWVPLDFWKQAKESLDPVKNLFWFGEFDELDHPDFAQVFDASYSWTWMHKARSYYTENQPLYELKELLIRYEKLGNDSMRSWFTSNHDENTWNGTEFEKYGELALPLAVFSCTWNGIPLLYNGQEIPLTNHRLQFFEKDTINWNQNLALEDFYTQLFSLRSNNKALLGGSSAVTTEFINTSADDKILAYKRENGGSEVVVFLNLSKEAVSFHFDNGNLQGNYAEVFSDKQGNLLQNNRLELGISGFKIFSKTEISNS